MAHINVVMPQMGESLTEGTLVRWLKQPGEGVGRDEPLFEISTDKVDTEVPAPAAGKLTAVLVHEGETVAVGQPVAVIDTMEAAVGKATPQAPSVGPAENAPADAPSSESAGHFKSSHAPQLVSFRRGKRSADGADANEPAAPTVAPSPELLPQLAGGRSYSPAVLGLAGRHAVPLEALTRLMGTGRGGRVTKKDVEQFVQAVGVPGAAAPAAVAPALQPSSDPSAGIPAEYLYRPGPGDERLPLSPVRRRIAHHMSWSVRISPHATAFGEIDMAVAGRILQQHRARFEEQTGAPLTYTALVSRAAVRALQEYPALNASILGDDLILKPHIGLGIAVALQDRDELIVPVVRNAEERSLAGMARAIHDLATRARGRALAPDDVQGGSFTLTNPGIFRGLNGTPILNQPQVAILGLGAIVKRAVVIDDAITIRPIMAVALTFDHRAADGMLAFRYLDRLRQLLEEPPAELTA